MCVWCACVCACVCVMGSVCLSVMLNTKVLYYYVNAAMLNYCLNGTKPTLMFELYVGAVDMMLFVGQMSNGKAAIQKQ